jgi:large subunit ribosomal protein L13
MKTFSQKPIQVERQWYLIDASTAPFGRLATVAASLLIGKGKPTITPHTDGGDYVIVINAERLVATADKDHKKTYYRHSGYPGGIYSRTLEEQRQKDPTVLIKKAVRGMLPANKLRPQRLQRLKVYAGGDHEHIAQKPQAISVKVGK